MQTKTFFAMALIAFFLTSCDKEPTITQDTKQDFDPSAVEGFYEVPDNYVDLNEFTVEGLTIKSGMKIPIEEFQAKAPNYFADHFSEYLNPHARAQPKYKVLLQSTETCDCGVENCPELGMELLGKKSNTVWVQCDNAGYPSPWAILDYDRDPKNLLNTGNYHDFYHQSWNGDHNLQITCYWFDGEGSIYVADTDGPIQTTYNVRVYFKSWHENYVWPLPYNHDENAVWYYWQTCYTCDACD